VRTVTVLLFPFKMLT